MNKKTKVIHDMARERENGMIRALTKRIAELERRENDAVSAQAARIRDLVSENERLRRALQIPATVRKGYDQPAASVYRVFIAIEHQRPDGTVSAITDPPLCVGEFSSEQNAGLAFELMLAVGRAHKLCSLAS